MRNFFFKVCVSVFIIAYLCCLNSSFGAESSVLQTRKSLQVSELKIQLMDRYILSSKMKWKNTVIGGLSGLLYKDLSLFAVSDDRGRYGPPRMYQFDFEINNGQRLKVIPKEVFELAPRKVRKNSKQFDLEALLFFKNRWIFSSEGNLNTKPRTQPEILYGSEVYREPFRLNLESFLLLPEKFLANESGVLKKGLNNNMAFEGMTSKDEVIYFLTESNLIQDSLDKLNSTKKNQIDSYLILYDFKSKKWKNEYHLQFENNNKNFLYFGASEITYWKENKFFIITRGIKFSADLSYDCQLWLLDLAQSASTEDKGLLYPQLLLNLTEKDAKENYEGMAVLTREQIKKNISKFGFKEGQNVNNDYLILVSDDNFNKHEKNEFLLFKINEFEM
ncbi:MAG: esterase-like activity of phytase family protein [Bdellovibrionaceae bacterium]|nr:esterase-like activity of phytase family protein [Pseudobdellovibrionaceae bacterium]